MRGELGWGWARDRKPPRVDEEQGCRDLGWAAGLGAAWSRPAGRWESDYLSSSRRCHCCPRVGTQCWASLGLMSAFQRAIPLCAVYLPRSSFRSVHLEGNSSLVWGFCPPAGPGACKQMAADEGEEVRKKQEQHALAPPASLSQVAAGVCAHGHADGTPQARALLLPTSRDPYGHPYLLPVLTNLNGQPCTSP